jgi:hypothetical protein
LSIAISLTVCSIIVAISLPLLQRRAAARDRE